MEFLKKLNPRIDWRSGTVAVHKKSRWHAVPAIVAASTTSGVQAVQGLPPVVSQPIELVMSESQNSSMTPSSIEIEECSFKSFAKGAKKGQYSCCFASVLQSESAAMQLNSMDLKFTHRAAFSSGDATGGGKGSDSALDVI